ncbi:MAG: bifunctional diaminohydroxyphosphoribosylaminopyrimidine deaminase/5-amino-6-(5-phosphoribosylamino)uracil reductase RibD [Bacteroidales bacterium]
MMSKDEIYLRRCLDIAKSGLGHVSPNPLVGAVIVKDDCIIGEGYHQKIGEAHAEVNAIASVKQQEDLKSSTIYVNLEPCVHHGKTPPCTDLIIRKGISRVVIGMTDPNPQVSGRGVAKLRNHGVEVITGVLEKEAVELNRRFVTFFTEKRPYIILKWAETRDGFIDVKRTVDRNSYPSWITNKFGKLLVHKWRSEEDAFMVGTHTAIMDNPQLTVREWTGRNPLRVTIDYDGKLPEDLFLFNDEADSIVFTDKIKVATGRLKRLKISSRQDNIEEIVRLLYQQNQQSLVVEGGAELLNSFIRKGLWDEARIFTGDHYFGEGVEAPRIKGIKTHYKQFGNSELKILRQ